MTKGELLVTETLKFLDDPQHRLIYLCEKGVVVSDGGDAIGGGSSRRFSSRNMFELSIALTLAENHLPAKVTTNFLYAVRSFETHVKQSIEYCRIPGTSVEQKSPEVIGIVTNGSSLHFSIGLSGKLKNIFGGVEIGVRNKVQKAEFNK